MSFVSSLCKANANEVLKLTQDSQDATKVLSAPLDAKHRFKHWMHSTQSEISPAEYTNHHPILPSIITIYVRLCMDSNITCACMHMHTPTNRYYTIDVTLQIQGLGSLKQALVVMENSKWHTSIFLLVV